MRRAEKGLPRVNALTDIYNAVSVLHEIPVGGEDLARYVGPARLVRATGTEPFARSRSLNGSLSSSSLIFGGRFPARPDRVGCGYCPYRDICPSSAA